MRILIIGFFVFAIWSLFSIWLYVDKILPGMKGGIALQNIPEYQTNEADSLAHIYASLPKDLTIYFEFDKVKFKTDPKVDISLNDFKSWLDKNPLSNISVTGHTDLVGTPDYNQVLGLSRAAVIKKYLEGKGIPPSRIIVSSRGEEQPVGDYLTEEGRTRNRRVEVSITK